MKKTVLTLFILGIIGTAAFIVGCETDSSDQVALTITPNHARIKVGESVTFKAGGFQDYTWSLSNPSIGVLSTKKGDTTVYTAVIAFSGEPQVLTVKATATRTVSSNSTQEVTASAEALITNYE